MMTQVPCPPRHNTSKTQLGSGRYLGQNAELRRQPNRVVVKLGRPIARTTLTHVEEHCDLGIAFSRQPAFLPSPVKIVIEIGIDLGLRAPEVAQPFSLNY